VLFTSMLLLLATAAQAAPPDWHPDWQPGPLLVDLGHQIQMNLPAGMNYLNKKDAAVAMELNGSFHNEGLLGLVSSGDPDEEWFVAIRYEDEGHVADGEAIDSDALLSAIREGLAQLNKERAEKGFAALTAEGWSDPPHYDASKHHLIWGLKIQGKLGISVNYNTRMLGRQGYASLNLVASEALIASYRPRVEALLAQTQFQPGARYEDYKAGSDRLAEYGLGGLILGGAGLGVAKVVKIGLLAKLGQWLFGLLLVLKKGAIVLIAAVASFLKKLFGGKDDPEKK
jgi:uncharacterized membrane-anchored protein